MAITSAGLDRTPHAVDPMYPVHVTIVEENHPWSFLGSIIRNLRDCPLAAKIAAIALPIIAEAIAVIGAACLGIPITPLAAALSGILTLVGVYELSAGMRELLSAMHRRV